MQLMVSARFQMPDGNIHSLSPTPFEFQLFSRRISTGHEFTMMMYET